MSLHKLLFQPKNIVVTKIYVCNKIAARRHSKIVNITKQMKSLTSGRLKTFGLTSINTSPGRVRKRAKHL